MELLSTVADEVPDLLIGDPLRIGQILKNLLGNAIKFTPTCGRIVVMVNVESTSEQGIAVKVTVSDSGVGIPEAKQKVIFEPFTQADASTTRVYGGTGLGLAIVRRLVSLMGGTVWVDSREGEGSSFHFTMVLGVTEAEHQTSKWENRAVVAGTHDLVCGHHPRLNLPVLIVEDNASNRRLLEKLLKQKGIEAVVAANGAEAVEHALRQRFSVILMDCQMPVMDGFEATSRIRDQPGNADVPIVALTANALTADRERCLAYGMDDYLSKPLDREKLFALLEKYRARYSVPKAP